MKHLSKYILTQSRAGLRMYICTWYTKSNPDQLNTSYENAMNIAEVRNRFRRTGRKLVSCTRDITYEYPVSY